MNSSKGHRAQGFTLIELLVTIAIIGFLASVILASLNTVREKANDAKRLSDMDQIRKALELFYSEYGRYPGATHEGVSSAGECIGVGDNIDTALQEFLPSIPRDPRHDVGGCSAAELAAGTFYYSYDPTHRVILGVDCEPAQGAYTWEVVYGFNRAESATNLPRVTDSGSDVNLCNADYNQALYPASP